MSYVYTYITPIPITIGKKITILANQPFYVGKGSGNRWKDHISPSRLRSKHQNWMKLGVIRHIRESGLEPIIEFSDNRYMTESDSFDLEKCLIAKFGRICDRTGSLTNLTLGSEGQTGWIPSKTTRELWSKQRKGKSPVSKGTKRPGIGGRPKGTKWSEEERKLHKIANEKVDAKATHKTTEYRKKMSDLKMGWEGSATGKFWFNNEKIETYSFICPEGFIKGRLPRKQLGKRGLVWFNNGSINRQFLEGKQEEGFNRGRISKK